MELQASDKYIGKYVIVDLTPEAEKYIEDVQADYHPFGKIENHACLVDTYGYAKLVEHLKKLEEYGLTVSDSAALAYRHWQRKAEMDRLAAEYRSKARQMDRIVIEGCSACGEFERNYIGGDEYGFCRCCNCELGGDGVFLRDDATGVGRFTVRYVPEKGCKYLGGSE